jgi:hypothetical protein
VHQIELFLFQSGKNLKKNRWWHGKSCGTLGWQIPAKMQTDLNVDILYFDGYCPACRLNEKQEVLQLNSNDFWECRACHLQLTTFVPYAAILRWRGEGKFRQTVNYVHNHHRKLILAGTSIEAGSEMFPRS